MSPEIEEISFQIIASVGTARSCYIEAIHHAKDGDFEAAEASMADGQEMFTGGHDAHFGLIQKAAQGEDEEYALILMHAEDQLMSAESFGILAREFIDVYKIIQGEGQTA